MNARLRLRYSKAGTSNLVWIFLTCLVLALLAPRPASADTAPCTVGTVATVIAQGPCTIGDETFEFTTNYSGGYTDVGNPFKTDYTITPDQLSFTPLNSSTSPGIERATAAKLA